MALMLVFEGSKLTVIVAVGSSRLPALVSVHDRLLLADPQSHQRTTTSRTNRSFHFVSPMSESLFYNSDYGKVVFLAACCGNDAVEILYGNLRWVINDLRLP